VDANQRAAALARSNVAANGLTNVRVIVADGAAALRDRTMDVVVTNPPIRAGRQVVAGFIADAWRVLRLGGRFYLVARTAQGARTLGRLIQERFGNVRQLRASGGYRIFEAERARSTAGAARETARAPREMADV
jgi:16S rRNA (guanine1207-N2)-methyltransferase